MSLLGALMGMLSIFLRVDDPTGFPPPLSAEKEREYFKKAREGDEEARNKLIMHNLRLVSHIVKKYYGSYDAQEDLLSIGTIGLIKAIDSYNIENGTKFATYAGKCLQNEILMHFRADKKLKCEVSINETIDIDKDGNPLTYMDVISCEDTIAEDLFIRMSSQKALEIIKDSLDRREREIIVRRYGLAGNEPQTQREISQMLGISRSYVSRIEKAALQKINSELKRRSCF